MHVSCDFRRTYFLLTKPQNFAIESTDSQVTGTMSSSTEELNPQKSQFQSLSDIIDNIPDMTQIRSALKRTSISENDVSKAISILSFLYRLNSLRNWKDLGVLLLDFLNSLGLSQTLRHIERIQKFLKQTLSAFIESLGLVRTQASFVKFKNKAKGLYVDLKTYLNSDIASSLRHLITTVFIFATNMWYGSDFTPQKVNLFRTVSDYIGPIKQRKISYVDLVDTVLEGAFNISELVSKFWYEGMTFDEVFRFDRNVQDWITSSYDYEVDKDNLYTGLPVKGQINARTYFENLVTHIDKGKDDLLLRLPSTDARYQKVRQRLNCLRAIWIDISLQLDGRLRKMPRAVMIVGPPGTGKSVVLQHAAETWDDLMGRVHHESHIYARQATEEYWSGYNPKSQNIIHYSELGSAHRNIVKQQGDTVIDEFLSVCDSLPYMCNMADLESKGKIYALPELILIDTNIDDMNLKVLKNNPAAVERRILYVEPIVKEQYKQNGSCEIDHAKVAANPPKNKRDILWFKVYTRKAVSNSESVPEIIATKADIFELTTILRADFINHLKKQESAKEACNEYVTQYITDNYTQANHKDKSEKYYADFYTHLFLFSLIPCNLFFSCIIYSLFIYFVDFIQTYNDVLLFFVKHRKKSILYRYIFISTILYFITFLFERYNDRLSWFPRKYISGHLLLAEYKKNQLYCTLDNQPCLQKNSFSFKQGALLFGSLYAAYKVTTSLRKIFTQGDVVMSSGEFEGNAAKEYLARIQKQYGCGRPRKVVKPDNHINWDVERVKLETIEELSAGTKNTNAVEAILKNVRHFTAIGEQEIDNYSMGIRENYMITNRHALGNPNTDGKWIIKTRVTKDTKTYRQCVISPIDFQQFSGDLIMICMRGEFFKDITEYIPTTFSQAFFGVKGTLMGKPIRAHYFGNVKSIDVVLGNIVQNNCYQYSFADNEDGICGNPVIFEAKGQFFFQSVHCANARGYTTCYSEGFTRPIINDSISMLQKQLGMLPVNSQGLLRPPVQNGGLDDKLSPKHPLRYEEVPGVKFFGELKNFRMITPKPSRIQESLLINDIEHIVEVSPNGGDGKRLFVPPPMKSFILDGEYCSPNNDFIRKVAVNKKSLDSVLMKVTVNTIVTYLFNGLKARGIRKLSPVDIETAMNGDPDNFYMRSMKPSTSGGFSWPGPKLNYCDKVDLDYNPNSYLPNLELQEQVAEIISAYRRDEMAHPLLGCQLKDEPRKNGKMTRMFTMSPVCNTIVHRMFLMPFYSLMVEFGDLFGTSIGINMHSYDVDDFCKGFLDFSNNYMEGDYGGYDTSMPPDITLMTNTIVFDLLFRLGYNIEQLQIVKGLLSDNLNPTMVLNGAVFSACGFQPSGKYATAEDNSLKGLILLVYYWIQTMTKHGNGMPLNRSTKYKPSQFWTYVHPRCYGDDFLGAVKDRVKKMINNVTYQEFCEEVYGMKYTDANKNLNMSPFLKWHETSFLKRNFVYRTDLHHWVAPIDKTSIMKSVSYVLPSRSESIEIQMLQATQSALRELFFHFEKDAYMIKRQQLAHLFSEKYMMDFFVVLNSYPVWDEMRNQIYPNDNAKK